MYHDTIHIKFKYYKLGDVDFDYSFLISKNNQSKFSAINYGILLEKFNEIGFNLKYLKFNDLELSEDIYCTYNYQSNFEIFFLAYKKFIHTKNFSLNIEYGNIVNGVFIRNNMTTFASVYFAGGNVSDIKNGIGNIKYQDNANCVDLIKDKIFYRAVERYQIIDKDGNTIESESTDSDSNFEQHFFEKYEVKVALRKYKLSKLMQFED